MARGRAVTVSRAVCLLALSFALASLCFAAAENQIAPQRIEAHDAHEYDFFGDALAIRDDIMVVGTWGKSDMGSNAGAVYVFARSPRGWEEQAKLVPSDTRPGQRFGHSVAVDEDVIVVGAVHDGQRGVRSGAAYVFERREDRWLEVAKLTASNAVPYQLFGMSVSISGPWIAVGAPGFERPAAYVFQRSAEGWSERQELAPDDPGSGHEFGFSVTVSAERIYVGAKRQPRAYDVQPVGGAAYVFQRTGTTWARAAKLEPVGEGLPSFGSSISASGAWIAVGAPEEGSVHMFHASTGGWVPRGALRAPESDAHVGFGVSLELFGSALLVGAPGDVHQGRRAGAAYLYDEIEGVWSSTAKLTSIDPAEDQRFGRAVSMAAGSIALGAAGDQGRGRATGAAYVITCPGHSEGSERAWSGRGGVVAPGVLSFHGHRRGP